MKVFFGREVLLVSVLLGIFVLSALLAHVMIQKTLPFLRKQCASGVRIDALEAHRKKSATPSMGGLAASVAVFACLLLALVSGFLPYSRVLGGIFTALAGFSALGAVDDLAKIRRKKGLSERAKWYAQWVLAAGVLMVWWPSEPASWLAASMGMFPHILLITMLWYAFMLVGVSNAINLTDGLDGLAAGVIVLNALWLALYGIFGASGAGMVSLTTLVTVTALAGGMAAFWWYNRWPARIFMGDAGSLMAGALIALAACMMHAEWYLLLTACVPVMETLSVCLQVGVYKLTKRRVFRMAPLHHHFEMVGYSERTIVRTAHVITLLGIAMASLLAYVLGHFGTI